LRLASLEADLAAYRYRQIILVLSDSARRREYPPKASYYLGEAYRLRNETGDAASAEREFNNVIETAPQFAPAHRALGLLYYKRGDSVRAASLLRQYLALAPGAADRAYVEYYLTLMETHNPADNDPHTSQ
jgi:Flp pilus assembly protein TadD